METALQTTGIIVLGILSGLLVNYLADILPVTRQVIGPPRCSHCYEEHSILNYLTFRRCNSCLKSRSARTWIVLIAFPLAFLWVWQTFERLPFWASAVLIIYLALIAIIDLEHRVVLHPTSIFGAVICFLAGWYLHGSIVYTLLGGIAGFAIMLGLYYLGAAFAKWMAKIRKEEIDEIALGFGDVNLSGVLGLLLGWPGILAGLFFAIMLGGVGSALYLIYTKITGRYKLFSAIPYAPFLIIAAVFLLYRP
jgi:prepilin signal peptidase PulO-like enzyme (type II secretory pathway)